MLERLARQVCWLHPRESGEEIEQGPGSVITSFTLVGPVFSVVPAGLSKVTENREVFRLFLGLLTPRSSPEEQRI